VKSVGTQQRQIISMKLSTLVWGFLAPLAVTGSGFNADELPNSVEISIQSVSSTSSPILPLATIWYNHELRDVLVDDYSHPDLSPDTKLLRVGVYDTATKRWKSAISTTSVENFGKGIRPTIVLSVDQNGEVLGAAVKGAVIDAGQTRDFGAKAVLVKTKRGKTPELNKPIVLSKEGTLEEEVPEKTLLQK
jgi:hypothetical protein